MRAINATNATTTLTPVAIKTPKLPPPLDADTAICSDANAVSSISQCSPVQLPTHLQVQPSFLLSQVPSLLQGLLGVHNTIQQQKILPQMTLETIPKCMQFIIISGNCYEVNNKYSQTLNSRSQVLYAFRIISKKIRILMMHIAYRVCRYKEVFFHNHSRTMHLFYCLDVFFFFQRI